MGLHLFLLLIQHMILLGHQNLGFGDPKGSYAVLEVKTNEVPFLLEDNQTIARIKYEKLNKKSNIVYGLDIKSNYQNQGLKNNFEHHHYPLTLHLI